MSAKEPPGFRAARTRAGDYARDPQKASELVDRALHKADRNKGRLARIWGELQALFRLVWAWAAGRYRQVPTRTIVLALGAVIYFLTPVDLIPDFVLGGGYLDDAAVVGFVVSSIREDIDQFMAWEQSEGAS